MNPKTESKKTELAGFFLVIALCLFPQLAFASVIIQDDFENGAPDMGWCYTKGSVTTELAYSGTKSFRVPHPTNESSGSLSLCSFTTGPTDEIWIHFNVYYAPGFDFPNGLKHARITSPAVSGRAGGEFDFGITLELQFRNGSLSFEDQYWENGAWKETYLPSHSVFQTGKWYLVEVRIRVNTPGQSDGAMELYVDGQQRIKNTACIVRGSNTSKIAGLWIVGNYSANATEQALGFPRTTSVRYFDEVVVSTERYISNTALRHTLPGQSAGITRSQRSICRFNSLMGTEKTSGILFEVVANQNGKKVATVVDLRGRSLDSRP